MGQVNVYFSFLFRTTSFMLIFQFAHFCQSELLSSINSIALSSDLQCLSELPVHQLLKIQKSLKEMSNMSLSADDSDDYLNNKYYENEDFSTAAKRRGLGYKISASADGYPFDLVGKETISALPLMGEFLPIMQSKTFFEKPENQRKLHIHHNHHTHHKHHKHLKHLKHQHKHHHKHHKHQHKHHHKHHHKKHHEHHEHNEHNEPSVQGVYHFYQPIELEKDHYSDGGDYEYYGEKPSHDDIWIEPEQPSKVQKIFQTSVTALSFLAFGGYLLCMIVQAIKSRGATYYHPTLLPMTSMAPSMETYSYTKRRPVIRLKRQLKSNLDSAEEIPIVKSGEPDPDDMYKILIFAAENYVKLSNF